MVEYRNIFEECAKLVPDCSELHTMEVCEKYLKATEQHIKDSYLSVLILRYWKRIDSYYYKSISLKIDKLDVLSWLFDSILCALNEHKWTEKDNKLYGDRNAFDKVVNRCLACARYTEYQHSNRLKRKGSHIQTSLDQLQEDYNDAFLALDTKTEREYEKVETDEIVVSFFNAKDYFKAFFIDAVVNQQVTVKGVYSDGKMKTYLLHLDRYTDEFSERYCIERDKVASAAQYIVNLGYSKIDYKLKYHKEELRRFFK